MKNLLHITEQHLPQKCRTCASVFERPEDIHCLVCVHLPDTSRFPRPDDYWTLMKAEQVDSAVELGLISQQDAMNIRCAIARMRLLGIQETRLDPDEIPF